MSLVNITNFETRSIRQIYGATTDVQKETALNLKFKRTRESPNNLGNWCSQCSGNKNPRRTIRWSLLDRPLKTARSHNRPILFIIPSNHSSSFSPIILIGRSDGPKMYSQVNFSHNILIQLEFWRFKNQIKFQDV